MSNITEVSKPTQWKPGQSGNLNGRPVGSRTAFSAGFLKDLAEVWASHGKQTMISTAPDQSGCLLRDLCPTDPERCQGDGRTAATRQSEHGGLAGDERDHRHVAFRAGDAGSKTAGSGSTRWRFAIIGSQAGNISCGVRHGPSRSMMLVMVTSPIESSFMRSLDLLAASKSDFVANWLLDCILAKSKRMGHGLTTALVIPR